MAEGSVGVEDQGVQKANSFSSAENKTNVQPPKQEVKQGNSPEKLKERALEDDLRDYDEGKMDLKNSQHVLEFVNKEKLEAYVRKIAAFYNLPESIIHKGAKSDIFTIKEESFLEYEKQGNLRNLRIDYALKHSVSPLNVPDQDLKNLELEAEKKAQTSEGAVITMESGKNITLLREKSSIGRDGTITHEILHNMSQDEKWQGLRKRGAIYGKNIDEAITEILNLHFLHPDSDVEALCNEIEDKIIEGKVICGYPEKVLKVLNVMFYTEVNRTPFTFQDLANYYFHNIQLEATRFTDADDYEGQMVSTLISRCDPKTRKEAFETFFNDLKGKESSSPK